MSVELIPLIDTYADHLEAPTGYATTDSAKQDYYAAMDKANEYRGDPTILFEALTLFQQTGNRPFFYAGIAYCHVHAAYRHGFDYTAIGLQRARFWCDRATQLLPNIMELLVVEAFIALRSKHFDEARSHLHRLRERDAHHFYVLLAHIEFYGMTDTNAAVALFDQARAAATSLTQEIYLRNRIARYLTQLGATKKAEAMYQTLTKLTPNDPWVWHNLSSIYLQRYQLNRAWQCNTQALRSMEFENARRMRRSIIRQYAIVTLVAIIVVFGIIVSIMNSLRVSH